MSYGASFKIQRTNSLSQSGATRALIANQECHMIMRGARMPKRRFAAVTVAASAMLLSTIAVAPSASADPYIGPGGEPKVDGIEGPCRWMDRPRGEESRDYLPSCAKFYVCLYVL